MWDVRYAEVYKPGPTRSFKGKCNIKNLIDTIVFLFLSLINLCTQYQILKIECNLDAFAGLLSSRIYGASNEVDPNSIPWQVGLISDHGSRPTCGGTIISEWIVLTAAHCVDLNYMNQRSGSIPQMPWYVAVKEHNFEDKKIGEYHKICKILVHDKWDMVEFDYDFALLYLKNSIKLDPKARPACLPIDKYPNYDSLKGEELQVSGWGKINHNSLATGLRAVKVKAMSNKDCFNNYKDNMTTNTTPKKITESMLCAADASRRNSDLTKNRDACQGDSGGKYNSIHSKIGIEIMN